MTEIVRNVELLKGWNRIAKGVGYGVKTCQRWQREGAPIYWVDGRWVAEKAELWQWIKGHQRE